MRNKGERDEKAEGWTTGGRRSNSALRRAEEQNEGGNLVFFCPGFSAMYVAQYSS